MLVQVDGVRSSDGALLAEVKTSVGTAVVRWSDDPPVTPGAHHVEWELDQEFRWGLNCFRAEVEEPRVCQDERGIVFRGRLAVEGTGSVPRFAHLELAGAVIDLGHVDGLPEGVAGSWVEIHVEPDKVKVHPYLV